MKDKNKIRLEENLLKEAFLANFCKKRGWNPNELTTEQLLQIAKEQSYRNPKIRGI